MTTIVSLMLRTDSHRRTGEINELGLPVTEWVPAYREDVDLDDLTPRARTLAEALVQQEQHPGRMGPGEIMLECDRLTHDVWPQSPDQRAAYGPRPREDQPARRHFVRSTLKTANGMGPMEYLEREARSWPMDWYIVGVRGCDPVASFEAGKADRVYTHETAREYLDLGPRSWDLLTQAGHLPAPDRWAHGRPHWYPETIDAYRDRGPELWPVSRVADYLGQSPASARTWLYRAGLGAVGRAPGRGGESLYAADQVQAVREHSPGKGRRGAARVGGRFVAADHTGS